MALSASDSLGTFDQTAKNLDLEPVLATVLLADTALLGLIGMGTPARGIKHEFNEDALNDYFVQASEAIDASETDITFDDLSKIRVGAVLKNVAAGKSELILCTAIAADNLSGTFTRGYGTTDGETHDDDSQWMIVGMPVQHGDETIADISAVRTTAFNYCQEFKRTVKIADQLMAEAMNGLHPGVPDELKYQVIQRTLEIKRELNTTAIHMVISAAPSDAVYGTMKGLREYLTVSGGNNISTEEGLSEKVVNKLYRQAWDDGGDPRDLIGGADQITQFAGFNAGKVRVAPSDRVAGVFVEKYLTEYGAELSLTLDRWFQKSEVALIQKDKVWISPFQGRALVGEPLARIGNAQRWQISGSMTLVVKNASKAHAYHTNLTVPA